MTGQSNVDYHFQSILGQGVMRRAIKQSSLIIYTGMNLPITSTCHCLFCKSKRIP